jgi:hypothetical protein
LMADGFETPDISDKYIAVGQTVELPAILGLADGSFAEIWHFMSQFSKGAVGVADKPETCLLKSNRVVTLVGRPALSA